MVCVRAFGIRSLQEWLVQWLCEESYKGVSCARIG